MPREVIGSITKQKLHLELSRLDKIRSTMQSVAHYLPADDELWTFRLRSLRDGLALLESFEEELERSFLHYKSGQPFDEDTEKNARRARSRYGDFEEEPKPKKSSSRHRKAKRRR